MIVLVFVDDYKNEIVNSNVNVEGKLNFCLLILKEICHLSGQSLR